MSLYHTEDAPVDRAHIREKIVADHVIDPLETTQAVLSAVSNYSGGGEMHKVKHGFPQDMQPLFPEFAEAA